MTVKVHFFLLDGQAGAECAACGERFFDSKGRKGNDCIQKCIQHAREAHRSNRGEFSGERDAKLEAQTLEKAA